MTERIDKLFGQNGNAQAPSKNAPGSPPAQNAAASDRKNPGPDPAIRPDTRQPSVSPQQNPNQRSRPQMKNLHSGRNVVPREGVAGQALMIVIAIMAFLACLTLGAVLLIHETAKGWQNDISREVTVQIRPFENVDIEESVRAASRMLLAAEGVEKVTRLDDSATKRLLEPFLGSGLQLEELPIPALLTVSLKSGSRPDFVKIKRELENKVPGASLDDHRNWVDRLTSMANTMVLVGALIFVLMMTATVLTVVFATRGAMAGNKEIVDVLHFVGADRKFIAREFEHHFLRLGMLGAVSGGIAAILIFLGLALWSSTMQATPQAEQMTAFFGSFSLGFTGLIGIFIVSASVAVLTGLTSRITVMRHVARLETYGNNQNL